MVAVGRSLSVLLLAAGLAATVDAQDPGAPCFRGGCDEDMAYGATDAGSCAAAGAPCVFDANADPNMGESMCAGPLVCPTETAAMTAAMMASADPNAFMMNADGSMNLAEPTVAAFFSCNIQCQMPDNTTCSTEIAGLFANAGAGMNAVRCHCQSSVRLRKVIDRRDLLSDTSLVLWLQMMTQDDLATQQDETMEACMAHAECGAYFTCADSAISNNQACPGDSTRTEAEAFTPCINDATCMGILSGLDDPSQDDIYTSGW